MLNGTEQPATGAEPLRWGILAIFSISSAFSAFSWLCFAPISTLVETTFAATAMDVNMLSLSFMIAYLPASIVSVWIMERYGLRVTLLAGAFTNAAMNWTKFGGVVLGGWNGFAIILAGQCIGALGQPLILNIPARLTMDWFPQSERGMATVAATMANVVGQMAGSLLPALLVTDRADFRALMLYQAVPCTAALLVAALCARDRPAHPPSVAVARQWKEQEDNAKQLSTLSSSDDAPQAPSQSARALVAMWRDTATLMSHRNFMWLCASFSLATGMAWTLLTLQAQIIQPCGYSSAIVGASSAALLGVGIVSSFAIGAFLQRSNAYLLTQKLLTAACAVATLGILAVNRPGSPGAVVALWCVLGAAIQPLMPASLEHAAEMTFPVSADSSAALLLVAANVFGCILTLVLTVLVAEPSFTRCSTVFNAASGTIAAVMLLGVAVTLPLRKEYRRTHAEEVERTRRASACSTNGGLHNHSLPLLPLAPPSAAPHEYHECHTSDE
jgi:MFS family permease